jgi:hypothetical protein
MPLSCLSVSVSLSNLLLSLTPLFLLRFRPDDAYVFPRDKGRFALQKGEYTYPPSQGKDEQEGEEEVFTSGARMDKKEC